MKQRTLQQNKSLHLLFEKLSEKLNDAGYNVMKTLRHDVEIDWSPILIKELIWKSIQKSMYDKESTTELTSGEMQAVYETLNRHLGEKFHIHIPWPSLEALIEEDKEIRKHKYPADEYGGEEPDFG